MDSKETSILIGRTPVNVTLARKRKDQKSTGSATAQNGTKSDERFQKFSGSWSKKEEPQRRSGSGKEVLLNISQWKPMEQGHFSVTKWESKKHRSWCIPVEGLKGHVAHLDI